MGKAKRMMTSREIPISVHPEYRMGAANEAQRKTRIFVRSSSLPCGPTGKLVTETLEPSHANRQQSAISENTQNTGEMPIQKIKRSEDDGFSEIWETGFSEDILGKLHDASEETEKKSYFFSESPVVRDLEMFEDYYTSDPSHPMKQARRGTFSPDSSGKSHLTQKITGTDSKGFHKNKTSFIIPIKLGFDEIKHNRREERDLKRDNFQTESVIQETQNDGVLIESKMGDGIAEEMDASVDGTAIHDLENEDCVMEADEKSKESDRERNHIEANTEKGQDKALNPKLGCPSAQGPLTPEPQLVQVKCDESEKKLSKIQTIINKAQELEKEVNAFSDTRKTKKYLILEEVLTCCLIDLDGIEANQDEHVRMARKKGVRLLQQILARLEGRIIPVPFENGKKQKLSESLKISA